MRNKGYVKRGSVIDVQIRDEYFVSANIKPTNKEKTEFKCDLSIHDTGFGISVELDETATLLSTYKTINKDATDKLNELIDNGYFTERVRMIENMFTLLNDFPNYSKRGE